MSASADRPSAADPLPEAVLWDMDGTLVDTEPYWIAAEIALATRDGGTWTHEDGLGLIGKPLTHTATELRERAGVGGSDAEIVAELVALVVAQVGAHGVPWRPGALELLAGLRGARVPCALVTSAYTALADAVVAASPAGTFDVVVTGDMVERGKPDPEPYLAAAARLGVDPNACVAIEDSPTGIASAEAAGCRVIAVQLFLPLPPAPGRSRLSRLDQITVDDLRRIRAGGVLDLLGMA